MTQNSWFSQLVYPLITLHADSIYMIGPFLKKAPQTFRALKAIFSSAVSKNASNFLYEGNLC